jgi:hypothetical protein
MKAVFQLLSKKEWFIKKVPAVKFLFLSVTSIIAFELKQTIFTET